MEIKTIYIIGLLLTLIISILFRKKWYRSPEDVMFCLFLIPMMWFIAMPFLLILILIREMIIKLEREKSGTDRITAMKELRIWKMKKKCRILTPLPP